MREKVKTFLFRGMIFGGMGPIVLGIVYYILSFSVENFSLSGKEVFLAIISVYILAFIQAGASVFNQIEEWSLAKCSLVHLCVLYIDYFICYLINTWIPFEWIAVLIFTGVFVVVYFIIWLTVYLIIRKTSKKLNEGLK